MMSRSLTAEDQYLVLASDGLWDDMNSDRAMGFVRKAAKSQAACEALGREMSKKYSGQLMDDLTVCVVRFLHN